MLKTVIFVLFAGVLLVSPAWAQAVPVTKSEAGLAFAALGHTLSFPLPDWLSAEEQGAADPLPLLESTSRDDGKEAVVEFVPKGQSFDAWTMRYAVRVILQPERTLEDLRQQVVLELSQTCKPDLTGFFQFGEEEPGAPPALGFACGGFLDSIAGLSGQGEIAVIAFKRSDKGLATIVEEWRGPAFDPSAPASWPIATTIVQNRADRLHAASELQATE